MTGRPRAKPPSVINDLADGPSRGRIPRARACWCSSRSGRWFAPLLRRSRSCCSAAIVRLRTVADRDTRHRPHSAGQHHGALGATSTACVRQTFVGAGAPQGRLGLAVARGDVRDAAAADGGQRRSGAESVRVGRLANGLAPLRNTHTATPPPIPSSSAATDPMNGPTGPAAAGVEAVAARADQDERRGDDDQRELVFVPVGQEEREVARVWSCAATAASSPLIR